MSHTDLFAYTALGLTLMFSMAASIGAIATLLQWIKDSAAPPPTRSPTPTPSKIIALRAGAVAFAATLTAETAITGVIAAFWALYQ